MPRFDLFVYIFEHPGIVEYSSPRLPEAVARAEHGCRRPLQIIEAWIPDLRTLVSTIYSEMYTREEVTRAAS